MADAARMERRPVIERLVIVVVSVLVAAFVVTTILVRGVSRDARELSNLLVHTAVPRIEHVATMRATTLELQLALADLVASTTSAEFDHAEDVVDELLRRVEVEVQPLLEGPAGQRRQTEVDDALGVFESSVLEVRAVSERDPDAARALMTTKVFEAANHLGNIAMHEIELGSEHARTLAMEIDGTRRHALRLSYGLALLCIAVGFGGVVLIRYDSRRRLAEARARAELEHDRAEELERFAGRVAHDIRGSLSSAMLAGELLSERSDGPNRLFADRIGRSLGRAEAIIAGLLDFARAGARPDPGARTDVRTTIDDLAAGLAPELERARIELVIDAVPPVLVCCSAGVYLSLAGNLVRNAMKYMGDRERRVIRVRVTLDAALVRTEVIDTGPGIPEEIQASLFEPYFRAASRGEAGLGLGLATVRKLARGHGGDAGVRSVVGSGSTFWFDLPHGGAACDSGEIASPEHSRR